MKRIIILLATGLSSVSLGLSLKLLHHQVSHSYCTIASRSQNLSYRQLKDLAQSISVQVKTGSTGGSGTLIGKEGDTYTVLTTAHTIATGQTYKIHTSDGQVHEVTDVQNLSSQGNDIALVQFQSPQSYQIAKLGSSEALNPTRQVLAAGFSADREGLSITKGEITLLPNRSLKQGYQIGYTNSIHKGMSGGPLLNLQGEVISINGMMPYPLWGNPYIFEDGSRPNPLVQQQMREAAWGIPIDRIARAAPESVALNVVETIDAIARESTVLIGNSENVGSGTIVARNESTYYVLTAEHVIRDRAKYNIVAPDGQCYSSDLETAHKFDDVDLAILEFTSDTPYRVATLADYNWRATSPSDYVFVSGWPVATPENSKTSPTRLLTSGRLLSQDHQIQDALERTNAQGKINALSLTYGYEMVYSNLTAPGMSGGSILDSEGRTIGIHGRGSGEVIEDDLGGIRPLKFGYGVGIPIQTFLQRVADADIELSWLNVESNAPPTLTSARTAEVERSLLEQLELPKSDTDTIAWFNRGMRLWQLEQYADALQSFDRAIARDSSLYRAWYGRGMMLRLEQQYDGALIAFERAIAESAGNFTPAWRAQAEELVWLQRNEEALHSIKEAIALDPNDVTLYEFQGHLLQRLQRYSEAISTYETLSVG